MGGMKTIQYHNVVICQIQELWNIATLGSDERLILIFSTNPPTDLTKVYIYLSIDTPVTLNTLDTLDKLDKLDKLDTGCLIKNRD